MTRIFNFTPDEKGKADFTICWLAFMARGNNSNNQQRAQQTKNDHLLEAKILRALKSISDPIGDLPSDAVLDMRSRKLKVDGGKIELEQSQFARLLKFVEETQWQSILLDAAVDAMERLETAEKIDNK